MPQPSIGRDLGELLYSGSGADYTIAVGDEEIKCHRIVLEARSPVFRGMLGSSMSEVRVRV